MSQQLFEYVVLYHPKPTKEQAERGEHPQSELIVDVKRVLATGNDVVGMKAARDIPEKFLDKLDQVEIKVRPF